MFCFCFCFVFVFVFCFFFLLSMTKTLHEIANMSPVIQSFLLFWNGNLNVFSYNGGWYVWLVELQENIYPTYHQDRFSIKLLYSRELCTKQESCLTVIKRIDRFCIHYFEAPQAPSDKISPAKMTLPEMECIHRTWGVLQ